MSYYGVRKVKQIQKDSLWNISCEYYDSSIRDWDGKRVWHTCPDGFFKNWYSSKDELERALFKDTLDGNIHGTGGKFACIDWNSRQNLLSEEEAQTLKELEEKKYALMFGERIKSIEKRLKEAGLSYADMESNPEWQEENNRIKEASKVYNDYRYNTYYKRWQEQIEKKKQFNRKENKRTYIVEVNYSGHVGIYVKGHGTNKTTFSMYEENAKLFTKPVEELIKIFGGNDTRNNAYSKVTLIDVTNFIVGTGKYRRAKFPEQAELTRISIK